MDKLIRRLRSELPLAVCVASRMASYLVPARFETRVMTKVGNLSTRFFSSKVNKIAAHMAQRLGSGDHTDYTAAARDFFHTQIEGVWGIGRGMRRNGWNPTTELFGEEYLTAALKQGQGAILWRISMGSAIAFNHALARAGHEVVHLSREDHLVRHHDWWSLRVAAPLMQRGETRTVAERVVIPIDGQLGYVKTLRRRLSENRVVTIVGDAPGSTARRQIRVRILGSERTIPTGAPSFAHRTGAGLLPAYAIRAGAMHYHVQIGPPISPDRSLKLRAYEQQAVEEYARRIDAAVRAHPESWRGWRDGA